jgi:heme-degrading monooxygenase HmoA
VVVVIFGTQMRTGADPQEYAEHSERMDRLVRQIPGFTSIKGYVGEDGERIAIVRFENREALETWRSHPEHQRTQQRGRESFYQSYWVQVCPTLRDYEWHVETGRTEHRSELPD